MKTSKHIDLGTLFFGAYRRQVLGLLLLHPDESFHLREIARVTQTQPGTLRRELTQLADAGVLSREKIGNLVRYRADNSCPIYEELRSILKKTAGVVDVLRDALAPLCDRITVAFVFGSIASGGAGVSALNERTRPSCNCDSESAYDTRYSKPGHAGAGSAAQETEP